MKLSIIIPAFNAGKTIGQQLNALKKQKWDESWEVIIADNGSTDDTVDTVSRYKDELPGLHIVNAKGKKGPSYARNAGAREAKGDAFIFIDADDVVGSDWLYTLGSALRKYEMVASRFEQNELNSPEVLKIMKSPQLDGLNKFRFSDFLPFAGACGLGVRREVHEKIGGFDEALIAGEDIDYCWRAQLQGVELSYIPDAVVHIRLRGEVKGVFRQYIRNGEYSIPIYKKYRDKGMQYDGIKAGLYRWYGLIRRLIKIRSRHDYTVWLKEFGYRFGILKGCLKYRVLAL